MNQQLIWEKIPVFGGMVSWFFAAAIASWLVGFCCCEAEYY